MIHKLTFPKERFDSGGYEIERVLIFHLSQSRLFREVDRRIITEIVPLPLELLFRSFAIILTKCFAMLFMTKKNSSPDRYKIISFYWILSERMSYF